MCLSLKSKSPRLPGNCGAALWRTTLRASLILKERQSPQVRAVHSPLKSNTLKHRPPKCTEVPPIPPGRPAASPRHSHVRLRCIRDMHVYTLRPTASSRNSRINPGGDHSRWSLRPEASPRNSPDQCLNVPLNIRGGSGGPKWNTDDKWKLCFPSCFIYAHNPCPRCQPTWYVFFTHK